METDFQQTDPFDDPFATFTEWHEDPDEKAYADL
jgi:hypothetical protein